jgi:hypothetical protein
MKLQLEIKKLEFESKSKSEELLQRSKLFCQLLADGNNFAVCQEVIAEIFPRL